MNPVVQGTVEVAGAAASIIIPAPGADLLKAVAGAGAEAAMPRIQRLAMRLFRPHLSFVLTTSAEALEVRRALEASFHVFRFPPGQARAALAFTQSASEIAWVA